MERSKLMRLAPWALAAAMIIAGASLLQGGDASAQSSGAAKTKRKARVVYPKRTQLDFDGTDIEGELKSPAEFYFQHRPSEKFDSLVKRRPNFHREMLRDVVLSK